MRKQTNGLKGKLISISAYSKIFLSAFKINISLGTQSIFQVSVNDKRFANALVKMSRPHLR